MLTVVICTFMFHKEIPHIENVKKPSKHTQKCKAVFDFQIANWLVDKYVLDYTYTKILEQQARVSKYKELECLAITVEFA